MIVPMKKIAVIVQDKDAQAALSRLRNLGVLHVEHAQPPKGEDLTKLQADLGLLERALNIISSPEFLEKNCPQDAPAPKDWHFSAGHIAELYKRLEHLEEYSQALKRKIIEWQAWGDFDPGEIEALAAKGIFLRLYEIPLKELKNIPREVIIQKIFTSGGQAHCLAASKGNIELGYPQLALPKMGLRQMQKRLAEDSRVIEEIRRSIKKYACMRDHLIVAKLKVCGELTFHEALAGMGLGQNLKYITGYIPADAADEVSRAGLKEKWGILISDPGAEDQPPTLLRNPRWIGVFNPVLKLLEILPGYREFDVSPVFLFFLSLFFGMIIGDAGYGMLYMGLTYIIQRRFRKRLPSMRVFHLLYIFSSCAVFWGLLTGTFFGQEWYLKAGFRPLLPLLTDTKFLQAFCFFLGAFHLSLGQAWQGIRKLPSLTALADIGWISILWAAFFIARTLILDAPFPHFGKWLIIAGLFLAVFFSHPQKNIFKTIGYGLGAVALSLMNNFTDVVSYVRLFAVGLAGVAISDTINALAAGIDSGLARVLILGLGHTINIILGPMSVLVHGIRLNVLEFSSHAGLSWGGVAYKPLQE